ncbi:MAG: glycerophosphodiester phosphodiesterase [Actinomycetes bacterium]
MASQARRIPKISWHRGGAEVERHASRAAFLHALRSGAEMVEIDVREMADGTLVCVHDQALEGIGTLREVSYRSLSATQQAEIYTLEELVADLEHEDPSRTSTVHFDLKEVGHELRAVDALLASNRPFFVTTLEKPSVVLLRRERPHVVTLLTIGRHMATASRLKQGLQRLRELAPFFDLWRTGASGIAIHVGLAKPWTLWWCRLRHLMVVVWTIDGTKNLEHWLTSRVEAVTTNRPMKALEIRRRLSER